MRIRNIFHKFKKNNKRNKEREQLISEINHTITTLESVNSRFEYITEPDLIDCNIFELNAIQLKYKFLLNKIKEIEYKIPIQQKEMGL